MHDIEIVDILIFAGFVLAILPGLIWFAMRARRARERALCPDCKKPFGPQGTERAASEGQLSYYIMYCASCDRYSKLDAGGAFRGYLESKAPETGGRPSSRAVPPNANAALMVGLAMQLFGFSAIANRSVGIGTGLLVLGLVAWCVGCGLYAKSRGWSPWLGMLGAMTIPGLLVIWLLPNRDKGRTQVAEADQRACGS